MQLENFLVQSIHIHPKLVKQWKLNQVKHGRDGTVSFPYIINYIRVIITTIMLLSSLLMLTHS
jgi:hypothetical protein